ncbi:MAG: hypothetical protein AAGM22_29545, partial [Acidobacteriota bacterium]
TGAGLALQIALAPIVFALAASALRLYPFSSRLVLFLLPSLGLAVAAGLAAAQGAGPRIRALTAATAALLLTAPTLLTSLWLPGGGLPITADGRQIFEDLRRARASDARLRAEPVVLGHLATYPWRRYAVPVDGPVLRADDAWLDADRVASLRDTLNGVDDPAVWVVLTRVRSGRKPRPWTYGAFIQRQRTWPAAESFSPAIEDRWRVGREQRRQGAVLWRLVRTPER